MERVGRRDTRIKTLPWWNGKLSKFFEVSTLCPFGCSGHSRKVGGERAFSSNEEFTEMGGSRGR